MTQIVDEICKKVILLEFQCKDGFLEECQNYVYVDYVFLLCFEMDVDFVKIDQGELSIIAG